VNAVNGAQASRITDMTKKIFNMIDLLLSCWHFHMSGHDVPQPVKREIKKTRNTVVRDHILHDVDAVGHHALIGGSTPWHGV
jgi:hypothetical protein